MMMMVGTRSDEASGPPSNVPELELDLRTRSARKAKPKRELEPERPLELAVDPQALVLERAGGASATTSPAARILAQQVASTPTQAQIAGALDVAGDARLLADCGDPPRHWLLSPLYAWRVLNRRRALKLALIGRRSEAVGATREVDDALMSFAERVRATAQKNAAYTHTIEELRRMEEVEEARDALLARERVTHKMLALAKSAVLDRSVFGVDFDPAREKIARLQLAAQSAVRDVTVHEAALSSYDERSLRQGLIVMAVLVLVLIVAPVVWRATRVVEPPDIHVLTDH